MCDCHCSTSFYREAGQGACSQSPRNLVMGGFNQGVWNTCGPRHRGCAMKAEDDVQSHHQKT